MRDGGKIDAAIDGLRVRFYPHCALRPLHHAVDRFPLQAWLDDGVDVSDPNRRAARPQ